MRLIERYIFRRAAGAFLVTLVALAGVVWVTQALRQMNIITAKGAALLVFLEITALALPFLVVIIAPFALLIACIQTLNSLNAESELVVLNASGASRFVVLRPLMVLAVLVSAAMTALSIWGSPIALRMLREQLTQVNVNLVSNIVQPGRFVTLEGGLTFHIRNRSGDGSLAGLFIDDKRDPEIAFTYIAEQASIVEMFGKTLVVMRDGVIERRTTKDGNLSLVDFQSYAFDLSGLAPQSSAPVFRPSERPIAELWTIGQTASDDYAKRNLGRFRAELHERLSQPLLPLSFTILVFLALGDARTTRQGRTMAILQAIIAAALLRGGQFAASSAAGTSVIAAAMLYALNFATLAIGFFVVATDRSFSLPRPIAQAVDAIADAIGDLFRRIAERLNLPGGREAS